MNMQKDIMKLQKDMSGFFKIFFIFSLDFKFGSNYVISSIFSSFNPGYLLTKLLKFSIFWSASRCSGVRGSSRLNLFVLTAFLIFVRAISSSIIFYLSVSGRFKISTARFARLISKYFVRVWAMWDSS